MKWNRNYIITHVKAWFWSYNFTYHPVFVCILNTDHPVLVTKNVNCSGILGTQQNICHQREVSATHTNLIWNFSRLLKLRFRTRTFCTFLVTSHSFKRSMNEYDMSARDKFQSGIEPWTFGQLANSLTESVPSVGDAKRLVINQLSVEL